MRKPFAGILVLILIALMPGFVSAQDRGSIVDVLADDADARFTTLVAAVEAADLAENLSRPGSFTVFAPTNDAFAAALDALGMTEAELLGDTETLRTILEYHVLSQRQFFRQLSTQDSVVTVQGEPITFELVEGVPTLNGTAAIIDLDNFANNGVVHVIDNVLLPPSLAETLVPPMEATEEAGADEDTDAASTEATEEAAVAHLRVAHLSPDAPGVDVFVDGVLSDVQAIVFPRVSSWLELEPGTYSIAVSIANTSLADAVIGPVDVTLDEDSWTTIAAVGSAEAGTLDVTVVVEDYTAIDEGEARVTVVHAIEGAPDVDVYANGTRFAARLGFPGTQGDNDGALTVDVPAGTADIEVRGAGSAANPVIVDLLGAELEENTNYFIAAVGTAESPDLVVVPTDMSMME